jgi:CubicO group peptidase (beta-lactamase class C family)
MNSTAVWMAMSALVVAKAAWATPSPERRPEAQQMYAGEMRPDDVVWRLSHSDEMFPVRTLAPAAHAHALPEAPRKLVNVHFTSNGQHCDLYDFLALDRVAGLLVLKDGKVAYEDYELGAGPDTHWFSASVAKSITSTLVGVAVQDGKIASLDDLVGKYLPALRTGAYADVTLRNVMQMASGIQWDETYTSPASDRRQLLELQLAHEPGSILKFMSERHKAAAPGSVWLYNTGETFIVGAVVEAAVGQSLAEYLSKKIWAPWGMESGATWWAESPAGTNFGGGGFAATLRDYARFGLFVMNDGVIDGQRVVPKGWFDEAGSRKKIGNSWVDYGYLWWVPPQVRPIHRGAFEAEGIFGQYIYINPGEHVVIAVLSAQPKPTDMEPISSEAFFAAVTEALKDRATAR